MVLSTESRRNTIKKYTNNPQNMVRVISLSPYGISFLQVTYDESHSSVTGPSLVRKHLQQRCSTAYSRKRMHRTQRSKNRTSVLEKKKNATFQRFVIRSSNVLYFPTTFPSGIIIRHPSVSRFEQSSSGNPPTVSTRLQITPNSRRERKTCRLCVNRSVNSIT